MAGQVIRFSILEDAVNRVYDVDLTDDERSELLALKRGGTLGARKLNRANILLMADRRAYTDAEIANALCTGTSTVFRCRRRFVEGGVERALSDNSRGGGQRLLTANQEACLVALACSTAPKGRARWTLRLLAKHLVLACDDLDGVSHETVRARLKEKKLKPWLHKMWCIRKVDASFIAKMEDILDLYAEEPDPSRPVVCFDEGLKQLIEEVKAPRLVRPGNAAQVDYHYRRNGTAKLLVLMDVHRPWREVTVSERRTRVDFALAMQRLVDVHYPHADKIRVVMDNLNTHNAASLYATFPAAEARRIARRLEFHHTPTHASWLNMVEIEIGALTRQCLDRRIGDIDFLRSELAACVEQRNADGVRIKWLFDVDKARRKMGHHYPEPLLNPSKAA